MGIIGYQTQSASMQVRMNADVRDFTIDDRFLIRLIYQEGQYTLMAEFADDLTN